MLINIFYFDAEGYFKNIGTAQVVNDEVLLPNNATAVVPELLPNKFYRWNGEAWESEDKPNKVEDFVGKKISHKSQEPHDVELRSILQKLVNESSEWRIVRGTEEEGLWWGIEKIPEPTEKEIKESRIAELKGNLSRTDYVVMKISEGVATEEQYAQVLLDRQEWRQEINELEAEIAALE